MEGQLGERRAQLDLGWHVADPLSQVERLDIVLLCAAIVALAVLEVIAEREQREHGLAGVGATRQLDRALEAFARLGRIAGTAEDAPKDAVGPDRGARLAQILGDLQGPLGGVAGEHVGAGAHVQGGGLAVEPDELERGGLALISLIPRCSCLIAASGSPAWARPAAILR